MAQNQVYEVVNVPKDVALFKCPARIVVAGPSESGKTMMITEILKHLDTMFDCKFESVTVSIPENCAILMSEFLSKVREILPDVHIVQGLPKLTDFIGDDRPKLLVIEDQQMQLESSKQYTEAFHRWSHHSSLSLIYSVQNIFGRQSFSRLQTTNVKYCILLDNPSDQLSLSHISSRIFPSNPGLLRQAMDFVQDRSDIKFKYIMLDFTRDRFRRQYICKTFIFPDPHNEYRITPLYFVPASDPVKK